LLCLLLGFLFCGVFVFNELGGGVLCFFSCQLGLLFDELGGIKFVVLFAELQHELVKFCKHQICVISCCLAS
jgi:hypothetical protein